jgi:hypothetical protein
MKRFFAKCFLVSLSWLIAFRVIAWDLEVERDGIKVYTEEIQGSSFKAFRGEMILQASLKEISAQLMDVEAMKDWLHDCSKSELVSRIEGREFIVYQETEAPWPVSNRDYLLHSKIEQDLQTKVILMSFTALVDDGKQSDECVRVTELSGFWRLTPRPEGQVYVEYETHADPAGALPAWLANSFVVDQPLNTLKNLAARIGGASAVTLEDLSFISELGSEAFSPSSDQQ